MFEEKNLENFEKYENEIREKFEDEFEKNKEEIIDALCNEDSSLTANIMMNLTDGHIYVFWDCGNTCDNNIVIASISGHSYNHDCYDCPLNDDNLKRIEDESERIDVENLKISTLMKLDKSFEDYCWCDSDLKSTAWDLRHECFADTFYGGSQWYQTIDELINDTMDRWCYELDEMWENGAFE